MTGHPTENDMLPPHPGKILGEELARLGLSASAFALHLQVPTNRITMVLSGQRSISPDTALRLAWYLGGDPKIWMDLQRDYDLALADRRAGDKIRRVVVPLSERK